MTRQLIIWRLVPVELGQLILSSQNGSGNVGLQTITVTTDSANSIFEHNATNTGESNNSSSTTLTTTLAPYPDLVISNVNGQSGEVIQDPARVNVSWKVTNAGSLAAQAATWVDIVYVSTSVTFNTNSAVEVGRFARSTALAPGGDYTRTEEVILPPAFTGRALLVCQNGWNERSFRRQHRGE